MTKQINDWQKDGDRRAIFLGCYVLMTGNMLSAADQRRFEDNEWVFKLIHHFAGYYFDALEAYDNPNHPAPAAWRIAYDASQDPETKVIQNLLLGINAHINYDLALALTDLLDPEWVSLPLPIQEARYRDYCLVNQIIADTVDAVQDQVVEIYSPLMQVVDIAFGPVDEWVAFQVITGWRDDVWQAAAEMLNSSSSNRREQMRQSLEKAAVKKAKLFLVGGPT